LIVDGALRPMSSGLIAIEPRYAFEDVKISVCRVQDSENGGILW
jgi:hypothetical protein